MPAAPAPAPAAPAGARRRAAAAAAAAPEPEPLTAEEVGRDTILPILDPEAWAHYKTLEAMQWTAQEIDLSRDRRDWDALPAGDRAYYEHIFAMFSVGDELVIANLGDNLLREVRPKECRYFLGVQAYNEQVHSESYAQQIQTLFDGADQERVLHAVRTMPVIAQMMAWAGKWMDETRSLGVRLAGWACFEGILFQGQFLALQMLKTRNVLPGITQINEYIARDEGMHCAFACFLLRERLRARPSEESVHAVVKEAVALHDAFVRAALQAARAAEGLPADGPSPVLHITESKMRDYIRHVADFVCGAAGYGRVFNVANPYPEASKQSLNAVGKTNFFEHEGTQYSMKLDTRLGAQRARRQPLRFCEAG